MSTTAERRLAPASFIKHAADVASFWGFRPLREVEREVPKEARSRGVHSFVTATSICSACIGSRSQNPVLAFYASPNPSHVPAGYAPRETGEFGLSVMGSSESLGEVLLLKTLFAIITEWGAAVSRVRVNALGDRDSKARFERELSLYLRKHANDMDEECRQRLSGSPVATYGCMNQACRQILQDGPRAVNFLSEKSRVHFREVLEHIENLGLPYELDDLLVGDDREPRVVFALDLAGEDATILGGTGGRFDEYVRKVSNKKDTGAVAASVYFRKKGAERSSFASSPNLRAPKVYFVQLGTRAKLQGLSVMDMLRTARVPVCQSFDAKSLGAQLASARDLNVSYVFIMGQREALDGTVIVRSTANSSQTTVELARLPRLLKTLS